MPFSLPFVFAEVLDSRYPVVGGNYISPDKDLTSQILGMVAEIEFVTYLPVRQENRITGTNLIML